MAKRHESFGQSVIVELRALGKSLHDNGYDAPAIERAVTFLTTRLTEAARHGCHHCGEGERGTPCYHCGLRN